MTKTRRLVPLLLALCLLLPLTAGGRASAAGTAGTVVGYYASWATDYAPEDIPAGVFTQINYAFAKIEGGGAALGDPARDGRNLRKLTALRERDPGLKIVLSVGGWDESTYFSDAASSAARRTAFAQSCLELLLEYGLDGVDLDWEYPVSGGAPGVIHRTRDRENFTLLLRAVRKALDQQERRDGKRYVLSIAGAADSGYLDRVEPQAVAETVDHIFVMTYDINGPWDARTGFNAPLYAPASSQSRASVDGGVSAWLDRGVPAEKLVLGMPLYGYIYRGVSSANSGLYSRFSGAASVAWDRVKSEYLSSSAYRQFRDEEAEAPYLCGNGIFLSYDDAASIAAKAALARRRGLGGIGFWELSQDSAGELVQSAWTTWNGGRFRDVPAGAWYASAVERVSAAGLMNGTAPGVFSPGGAVTRGQIAAILYRLAGEPAVYGSSFPDVPAAAYCANAVAWATRQGVVEGFPDGTFRPDLPVSRQQLAAILWRYARLERADSGRRASLEGFRDAGEAGAYAAEPLRWALAEGILQGTAQGDLLPQDRATRGQTAVFLERFMKLLA